MPISTIYPHFTALPGLTWRGGEVRASFKENL
jgi:hypothetical protein